MLSLKEMNDLVLQGKNTIYSTNGEKWKEKNRKTLKIAKCVLK